MQDKFTIDILMEARSKLENAYIPKDFVYKVFPFQIADAKEYGVFKELEDGRMFILGREVELWD